MELKSLKLSDFYVGMSDSHDWKVQESELDQFANLSGDLNPLHMSDEFATKNGFEGRVVHGFFIGAKLSGLIGMLLPGENGILLEQNMIFLKPVHVGNLLTFKIEVVDVKESLKVVEFKFQVTKNDNDKIVKVARGRFLCQIHS